jgi:hypothetical protein
LPDGQKVPLPEARSLPIIFQASVLPASGTAAAATPQLVVSKPAPQRRGSVPYLIHYSLPFGAFAPQTVDGKFEIIFGVAAVVLNRDGRIVNKNAERVTTTLNQEVRRIRPEIPIGFDQQINLKKDDDYLYLAVWDMTGGRLGTLQIPLHVSKAAK